LVILPPLILLENLLIAHLHVIVLFGRSNNSDNELPDGVPQLSSTSRPVLLSNDKQEEQVHVLGAGQEEYNHILFSIEEALEVGLVGEEKDGPLDEEYTQMLYLLQPFEAHSLYQRVLIRHNLQQLQQLLQRKVKLQTFQFSLQFDAWQIVLNLKSVTLNFSLHLLR
jgi:hypothetical protein